MDRKKKMYTNQKENKKQINKASVNILDSNY